MKTVLLMNIAKRDFDLGNGDFLRKNSSKEVGEKQAKNLLEMYKGEIVEAANYRSKKLTCKECKPKDEEIKLAKESFVKMEKELEISGKTISKLSEELSLLRNENKKIRKENGELNELLKLAEKDNKGSKK